MDNVDFAKETTGHRYLIPDGVTEFKIVVPYSITSETYKFAFFAATGNKTLLYGKAPNDTVQNYVLADIGYQSQQASLNVGDRIIVTPTPSTTPTPTLSTTPTPSTGEGITIYKYSTNTTAGGARIPLQGVTFELINGMGQSLGVKVSDASGTVNWSPLPLGTYHIYERSNNGLAYQLTPPTYQNVTLTTEQPHGIATFYNDPSGKITVIKEDAVTGNKIKGIEFELKQIDGNGNFVTVVETDAQGQAIFSDIPDGTYSVCEVSTVEPYIKDSTPQTIVVQNGQAPSLKFLNSKYPTLTIQKRDAKTGEVITSPVTFHIEQRDGALSFDVVTGQSYKLTGTTAGANGAAATGAANITNLPAGTYIITEKIAPAGWVLDKTPQTVHLGADQSIQIVMQNAKTPILTIEKLGAPPLGDATGNAAGVPGTVFTVKKLDGTMVGSFTTGMEGTVTAGLSTTPGGYLEPGTYEITEISVPAPFLVPTDGTQTKTVVLKAGDANKLSFVNERKPSLEILKIDYETKMPLAGAKFRIMRADGTTIREALTNADGKIILAGLDPQVLTIEEIIAPEGYLLDPQHKDIELLPGESKQLVFTNKAKPKLRIQKVDAVTGELLKNAEFRVQRAEGATISEYILETGEILLEGLEEKIYRVTEFMPPEGYVMLTESKEILLESGVTQTLKFDNVRKPVIMFLKTNGLTGAGIPGTTYKVEYELPGRMGEQQSGVGSVTSPNGGVRNLGSFKTDANGRIIIPKAEVGWYVFTETAPAPGMSMPSNPVTRMYFAAGDNAYLPEMDKYYTSGTGSYAGGTGDPITPTIPMAEGFSGADYHVQGEGFNFPKNSIVIKKTDANTGELLSGAAFELYKADGQESGQPGTLIGRYVTDASGIVVVVGLDSGYYVCKEVEAPPNYLIAETSLQNGFLKPDGTSVLEFTFRNLPYGSILITKTDGLTNQPLSGVVFKVTDATGAVVGNANGEYTTDSAGKILIPNVKPADYVITELRSAPNYALDGTPKTLSVGTDGKTYAVSFVNYPYGSLIIRKLDTNTKEPIANTTFKITTSQGDVVGTGNGLYTTDAMGIITIPNLPKNTYIVQETKANPNYTLEAETKTIAIEYGKTYTLDFYNTKKGSVQIIKIDAHTKAPLKGAQFIVYKANGEAVGTYTTDGDGLIILPLLDNGWYKAVEHKSVAGYLLDDTPKDFEIKGNDFVKLVFENSRLASLMIKKEDAQTGAPLAGVLFTVTYQNGQLIGDFETDTDGLIIVPTLTPGFVVVREKRAPVNYLLDETPKVVEIKTEAPSTVTFTNKKLTGIQIKKLDEVTGAPLAGVQFTLEKQSGERVGDVYTTDAQGLINIPNLAPDWYVIRETKSISGYAIGKESRTVEVKSGAPTFVTITNMPLSGLQIKKIDSVTRQPIESVEFSVSCLNGEKVGNYKTGKDGLIFVPNLTEGTYSVVEEKCGDGYLLDSEPRVIEIKKGVTTTLEVENTPMSGLLIVKHDAITGKPLQGVVYDVRYADGQFVSGNVLDKNQPNTVANSPNKTTSPNGDITGSYTTDAQGRILINTVFAGELHISERKALDGYEIDTEGHAVTLTPGKLATIQLTNTPKAGLRILKVDSITGKPISNVEFMIFDANGKVVGNFYSDNNGVVDLSAVLSAGRFTIRETREAEGYYPDQLPRTVEFVVGKMTEIVWKNIPQRAQIQITKLSADDNEINGLPAGTPLANAVFEVYDYKTGNMVDRFVTGTNGRGVSQPLPLGRYLVKEVQAPAYYRLNTKELDVTLEFATQIVKLEFQNHSANTGVFIKKTGNLEAMPGQQIRYDIKAVQNQSTVPLSDFYWREVLPVDAVRLDKLVTGTYNQSLRYKIVAQTNKGNTRIIADNLSTTANHVIDCSSSSLGLASDEFIVNFGLYFGTVKAGFTCVEQPQVYVTVNRSLPNGYPFSNKVDVGGKYGGEWIIGNSTWRTIVYRSTADKLPKTGY